MSFLNPLFWLGVAALAAPILVHLVRRTRARRVEFPALVFVRQVPQRTIRRRTLQNLLLLIIRCLAILLIVLAFTRPFFSGNTAANGNVSSGLTVVLIDTSLSMRREQMFAEAKKRAASIIDESAPGERLALLSFGNQYEIVSRFSTDRNILRTAISSLSAGWEGTDYRQALRGAASLLRDVKASGRKQIILISDFQKVGWTQRDSNFRLSADIQLLTVDVGGTNPPANVAVTNVEARPVIFGQRYSDNLAIHVTNFGELPRDRLVIDFQMNDQTIEKREIALDGRDSRVVEFTGFNLAEGANRCRVEVSAADFAPDNSFYFTLRRDVPSKALIVEGASRGRSESVYLQSALTTNDDLPFTFAAKTGGSVDPASLSDYSLLILNDVGSFSPALVNALKKFVESGGRLIISTGPRTEAEVFNRSLEGISPAILYEGPIRQGDSVAISDVKFDHPIFEVFRSSGRLTAARVFGYFRSQPRLNATVIARYEDGSPSLIESNSGKGRVLMFTSTLGTNWSDLPLTPLYLPFVHQMIRYLGGRQESAWHPLGQTFRVAKNNQGITPAVDSPAGERVTETRLTPDGDLLVTGREPGFYRLRYDARPDFEAVDCDGAEGDFTKLDFPDFIAGVTGGSGYEGGEVNRRYSNEEIEGRQKVWWTLLLGALLLLLTESVLARRTKVVRMVG